MVVHRCRFIDSTLVARPLNAGRSPLAALGENKEFEADPPSGDGSTPHWQNVRRGLSPVLEEKNHGVLAALLGSAIFFCVAPGLVAGVGQVNVALPAGLPAGIHTLRLNLGESSISLPVNIR